MTLALALKEGRCTVPVEAASGGLALVHTPWGWTVTHIASGRYLVRCPDRVEGLRALAVLTPGRLRWDAMTIVDETTRPPEMTDAHRYAVVRARTLLGAWGVA